MARPLRTYGQPSLRTLCAAAGALLWSLLPAHSYATTAMAAAGGTHSLLLTRDGTVWAWGSNLYGQLGTGSREDAYRPLPILDLGKADFIATGRRHSLAVKADGTVWGWGDNEYGQLGTGDMAPRTLPTQVAGLGDVVAVAGAREHSVALRRDGTVWAWGNNLAGQLGTGTEETTVSTPLPVPGLSDVVAIAAGDGYTLALARNGTLWGWGVNGRCQLGDEGTAVHASPIRVPGVSDIVAISASTSHNIALRKDGTVAFPTEASTKPTSAGLRPAGFR